MVERQESEIFELSVELVCNIMGTATKEITIK